MANLKPVLPSVIGRGQTVRRNVHPVRMPNPAAGLSDGFRNMMRGITNLGDVLADIHAERELADYRRILNEAEAEADSRMQKEVWSQEGFSAGGSSERAAGIYSEVYEKYAEKLSGRNSQRFQEAWGARRNSQMRSTMAFERRQLRGAQVSANSALMKREVENYASTLEDSALAGAKEAYDDTLRITNGGHLVTPETLARFDADVEDGKIKLPNGRVLRVRDRIEPGEKDVITKERLAEIRANMEKQSKAYETGLRNLYDSAHAQVVERYLKDDRLGEAEHYIAAISEKDNPRGASAAAVKEFRGALGRKKEIADVSLQASRAVSEIQAKSGAASQRYGSVEQDRIYAEVRRDLSNKYAGEKWKQGARIVAALDMNYRLLQEQQKATLSADTVTALTQMQQSKMSLPQQESFIRAMKDSPLKDALSRALARKRESFENSNDPFFVADQERRLTAFKLALGNGSADLDGVHYDFRNQEQLKAYVLNLGLTERNQKRAGDYIANSGSRIDAMLAGKVCARLLGLDDPAEALFRYPNLLAELDELKGTTVIDSSKMEPWLRTNITMLLSSQVTKDQLFFDSDGTVKDKIKNDASAIDKLYMNRKQLTEAWKRFRAQQALNRGDAEAAKAALDTEPTLKNLEDFVRDRGYDERGNGLYYLRGGK